MPSWPRTMHPALVPYVEECVGYDYRLDPAAVHFGLPSTSVTVIIAFDEPLDCGWLGERENRRFWLLASGLHDHPALIRTHGRQHGIQLGLTPLGARCLLGAPAGGIASALVDHGDLPLGITPEAHDRLSGLGWEGRFEVLQTHLLGLLAQTRAPRSEIAPELREAWRVLCGTGGRARVESVADHVGWSRRHLAARFQGEFGLAPKRLARVARFQRARALIDARLPLAIAAAEAGYADQSHLNRDWRALAGRTPTQAAEDFPIVQAGSARPAAQWRP